MRLLIVLAFVALFCASNAGAFCKDDCEQNYFTAKEQCKTRYNNPEDPKCAENCQLCIDQAYADYKSCLSECGDEWDDDIER
jgi:hypothetical protein